MNKLKDYKNREQFSVAGSSAENELPLKTAKTN